MNFQGFKKRFLTLSINQHIDGMALTLVEPATELPENLKKGHL